MTREELIAVLDPLVERPIDFTRTLSKLTGRSENFESWRAFRYGRGKDTLLFGLLSQINQHRYTAETSAASAVSP